MIHRLLLIGLAVCLVGCVEQPQTYVQVTYMITEERPCDGTYSQKIDIQEDGNLYVESSGSTLRGYSTEATASGSVLTINSIALDPTPAVEKDSTECANGMRTVTLEEYELMLPEEFQFKYDNDPEFKKNLTEYQFISR